MYAEKVRRQAIKEVLSLDISPRVAQRIWLRVSGVWPANSQLPCIFWAWSEHLMANQQASGHLIMHLAHFAHS